MSLKRLQRILIVTVLSFGLLCTYISRAEAQSKNKTIAAPVFTEDHYKTFSSIARTWNARGCEKEIPRKTMNAIERACHRARETVMLYRPKVERVNKDIYVQCILTSERGFMELSMGHSKSKKFTVNQGLPEFKIAPDGNIYAISQDGAAVGSGYCSELKEEVDTRKNVMGYSTFQSLFANQYSPGRMLSADEFFNQITKVTLCYKHDPSFVQYRCTKYWARQKQERIREIQKRKQREIASEKEKNKKYKTKYDYY